MGLEQIRRKMSALLMDTCEENPLECYIQIGEDQGLSSLDLPTITSIFQHPTEGIIYFNIEGCKYPFEFDEILPEDLEYILNILINDPRL